MSDPGDAAGRLETYVSPVPDAQPPPSRPPWRKAGVAIGVVVALIAGLFGLAALTSDGGEDSPEAAVQKLVDALAAEDVLGALEALVPAERALLRGRVVELTDQLRRLGIVDERLDLARVAGADLRIDGLKLAAEDIGDDVAVVRAEAGTVRLEIRGAELPVGPLLADQVGDRSSISSPPPADLADEDVLIVAVRRDGDWFVSLGYTVAELARREGGAPVPKFGAGVSPKGASSPEAAVRELVGAAAAFDVRRAVELAPPGEADALHDYAPLFLPAAERGAAELRDEGVRAEVATLELDVERAGAGEAHVTATRAAVNVTTDDGRFALEYDGTCIRVSGPRGEVLPRLCRDDADGEAPFNRTAFAYFRLTVVERDGAWFVSPTRSVLDAVLGSLRSVEREELARLGEDVPFALFGLVFPGPLFFGAGALQGVDGADERTTSAGTAEVCAAAGAEPPPGALSAEMRCVRPVVPREAPLEEEPAPPPAPVEAEAEAEADSP